MRNLLYSLFILILIGSCKGPVLLHQGELIGYIDREVPYQEAIHKKTAPEKLAFVLNDNPDTLNLAKSDLVKMLVNNGYRVILPGKPGQNVQERLELDSREYRIKDITQMIATLDSNKAKELLLIGFGEGSYLLPQISLNVDARQTIIVNAGPYDLLTEYEELLKAPEKNDSILQPILISNKLYSTEELKTRIEELKNDEYGMPRLSGGTNMYWLSYQRKPLIMDVHKVPDALWIISRDYPLITDAHQEEAFMLSHNLQHITFRRLEGRGNFNSKDEMEKLTELVETYIK